MQINYRIFLAKILNVNIDIDRWCKSWIERIRKKCKKKYKTKHSFVDNVVYADSDEKYEKNKKKNKKKKKHVVADGKIEWDDCVISQTLGKVGSSSKSHLPVSETSKMCYSSAMFEIHVVRCLWQNWIWDQNKSWGFLINEKTKKKNQTKFVENHKKSFLK